MYHRSLPISSLPSSLSTTIPSADWLQGGSSLHSTCLLTPGLSMTPDTCPRLPAGLAKASPASVLWAALTPASGLLRCSQPQPCPRAAEEECQSSPHMWPTQMPGCFLRQPKGSHQEGEKKARAFSEQDFKHLQ